MTERAKEQQAGLPAPGKKIRDVNVTLTDGTSHKLGELAGKKGIVLYFYPKDMTSGCTTEACDFRDSSKQLASMGYRVIGVSPDSVKSHQKFTEKQELNFPLISDPEQKLCNAFGVWGEKLMYGRRYMGVFRTTFVLGKDLKVRLVYPKVKVTGHVDAILDDLKAL